MADKKRLVRRLIGSAGRTYAEQSGIRLRDKPMPLFQTLVLAMLASKPIRADVAARAAGELFKAGLKTPRAVIDGDRDVAIEAFGRAGYARYDESSATRLCDMARRVRDEYDGDLRNLGIRCGHHPDRASVELQHFKGIGETGADVFLREVQVVWPWVRPYFDKRAAAALVGVSRDDGLRVGVLHSFDDKES